MANILRGYGLAREQGYFKQEQEADVQRHRKRLIKEGKLSEEEAAALDSRAQQAQQGQAGQAGQDATFRDSEHSFEVLPEVLQQSARLHDPHALRRREYERRVKGEPPPLSEADMMRARSKMYALGASVGHVPRMSMGRNRWSPASAGGGGDDLWVAQNVRQLTPEAREVASRTYVAGVRALVYGSLLGALGLAAATTYAIRAADIKSGEDLGDRIRGTLGPLSASLRSWMLPFKDRAQAWVDAPSAAAVGHGEGSGNAQGAELGGGLAGATASSGSGGATGEFQRRMQERYNARRGGGEDGGGGAGGEGADI